MAKQNKKVVKFHKVSQLNIGVVIFLIIFIYLLYNIYQYFTTEQIAIYEVSQGIGLFRFNLVSFLFGDMSWISRIVYGIVGIGGLYLCSVFGRIRSMSEA